MYITYVMQAREYVRRGCWDRVGRVGHRDTERGQHTAAPLDGPPTGIMRDRGKWAIALSSCVRRIYSAYIHTYIHTCTRVQVRGTSMRTRTYRIAGPCRSNPPPRCAMRETVSAKSKKTSPAAVRTRQGARRETTTTSTSGGCMQVFSNLLEAYTYHTRIYHFPIARLAGASSFISTYIMQSVSRPRVKSDLVGTRSRRARCSLISLHSKVKHEEQQVNKLLQRC
jgi:hypothetical protein